ncbi:MAG: 5'/3'-nucleotidase SurE [Bacteroidetes bacterium]|nr:5'/3'-nucleotidase SurE [Bacteroidota bacterium]
MPDKPQIFVTNDDGINAPGLATLVDSMKQFGELVIIAPKNAMSGVGHAITLRKTIEVEQTNHFDGIPSFALDGTPADCVKYAMAQYYKSPPDLLVSGINHGSNASVNMIYSGTVAAAVEGALYGVSSIAFSSISYQEDADLSAVVEIAKEMVARVILNPIPRFTLWNVNVPDIKKEDLKGYRFCRQSLAHWKEEFIEQANFNGKQSFWLRGDFICDDKDDTTDIWALENGYASIVPVYLDFTRHSYLEELKKIYSNEKK